MYRFILVLLLLAACDSYAQKKQQLKTGQPFPYTESFFVRGEKGGQRTIESYKGKYLLLDLFGSNCVECFQNMPKLDSFQVKYGKELNILLIGKVDYRLGELCRKFRERFNLKLDIAEDSALFAVIQYYFLPTYIWIGPDGLIKAVTEPDRVTVRNIETFISGNPLPFGELQLAQPFVKSKEFLTGGNGGADSNYLYRSILSRWNPSLPYLSHTKMEFEPGSRAFHAFGNTMEELFRLAFFGTHFWKYGDSLNGVVWPHPIISDSIKPETDDRYCYSASYRASVPPDLSIMLKSTLEQYFGYKGKVIRQSMPYYSVKIASSYVDTIRTKGLKTSRKRTHASLNYTNVSLNEVIAILDYYNSSRIPLINESGVDDKIDVNINAILTVEEDFIKALGEIGIIVEKKNKMMEVLLLYKE